MSDNRSDHSFSRRRPDADEDGGYDAERTTPVAPPRGSPGIMARGEYSANRNRDFLPTTGQRNAEAPREYAQGRTTYVSENYTTNTAFEGIAPPNSAYAADLREIAMNVQRKQGKRRELLDDRGFEGDERRRSANRALTQRSPKASSGGSMGKWYRYQTDDEVAYQSKNDQRRLFVSAPKGSVEAEQYRAIEDGLEARRSSAQQRFREVKPEPVESSGWLTKFWTS